MIWNILGILIGVLGIIIALYQSNEKRKLRNIIRAQNWFNYERAMLSNGTLQNAIKMYKNKYEPNFDMELFELLIKSDMLGQEVYMAVIRDIQMYEPSFQAKDFQRWLKEGKITEEKSKLFDKFSITDIDKNVKKTNKNTMGCQS